MAKASEKGLERGGMTLVSRRHPEQKAKAVKERGRRVEVGEEGEMTLRSR